MFWDIAAYFYDVFAGLINRKVHRELKRLVLAYIVNTDAVLECACGTGMLSTGIAARCKSLVATDFSANMLKMTRKSCRYYKNISFEQANIMSLGFPDESFDKVVAANVIHLLNEPERAVKELERVCRAGGVIIVPTYINEYKSGKSSFFSEIIGKAGVDFKRQFTYDTYKSFFEELGYENISFTLIKGFVPCGVAFIKKDK